MKKRDWLSPQELQEKIKQCTEVAESRTTNGHLEVPANLTTDTPTEKQSND